MNLSKSSDKAPQTITFVRMTKDNQQNMMILDLLLRMLDYASGVTPELMLGKALLHAVCIHKGFVYKVYDAKTEEEVFVALAQMRPEEMFTGTSLHREDEHAHTG